MNPITSEVIRSALHQVKGPDFESDIVSLGLVSEILIAHGKVFFSITVPDGRVQEWESLRRVDEEVVCALDGVESVVVTLTAEKKSKVSS
uniref:iron-sulfur cluster assembly protein n=1 Tax=Bartonella grahamii TaxID=33045 RepID=UPI001ABA267C